MGKAVKKKPVATKASAKKTATPGAKKKATKKVKLPLPAAAAPAGRAAKGKLPKPLRKAEKRLLGPLAPDVAGADAAILDRL